METRLSSWREMLHPVWEHYQKPGNEAGGHLHVVLDDGNLDTWFLEDDKRLAEGRGDEAVASLCQLLLAATTTQREKLYEHYQEYMWGAPEPKV